MIYKMDLKDSSDTMTFNLLETPIVDKDIEGAVDNVTLDGNQYTDYLYLKKQYIQKWAIMCPDEYDELRGFYTRQFEDGEVPSYRVYYGANVTRDYTFNGDYFQFNAEGIETGMTLSQLLGNAEQTTYSGKNLLDFDTATLYTNASVDSTRQGNGFKSTIKSVTLPTYYDLNVTMPAGTYTLSFEARCQNSNSLLLDTHGYIFGGRGVLKDASGATASESYRTLNSTWKKFSFTITTTASMAFTTANALHLYFLAPDSTQVFELQNPMFESGSSATEYEQFVGGTPSPNPDYPQPISTVTGAQNIEVVGKNLLGLQDDTLTSFGVDFAINNGTITASGTTTAGSNAENDNIIGDLSRNGNYPVYATITEANSIELRAGTYTVSAEITKTGETSAGIAFGTGATMGARVTGVTKLEVLINDATGTYIKTATFTIAEGERLYISTYYEGNATKKNVGFTISNIQLELGSTATAYEPYQGQSYEVNLGKNLLSPTELPKTQAGVTGTYQDGIFSLSGTASVASNFYILPYATQIARLEAGESLTYYIERVSGTSRVRFLTYFVPDDGSAMDTTWEVGLSAGGSSSAIVKTATKAGTVRYVQFFLESGVAYDSQVKILVQKGGIANPTWAPYFTPIELAKVGTYQDRIYKDDGKWYIEKQIEKATFDGSSDESWTLGTTGSLRYPFGIDIVGKGWASSAIDGVMCDTFTLSVSSEAGIAEQYQFTFRGTSYNNRLWFFCPKSAITGSTSAEILASYKTFLSTHPTTVYYALATPTTTEITNETLLLQLNFLASLYGGENNISLVGTGAQGEMEVFIRDVMSVETDVVPEVPVRLTLTDDGVINACGCRRNVQLTMRETVQ